MIRKLRTLWMEASMLLRLESGCASKPQAVMAPLNSPSVMDTPPAAARIQGDKGVSDVCAQQDAGNGERATGEPGHG